MRKPRMLFTNLFLLSRTGSELHLCEIAKAFISRGWDVTGFALVVGYPIQGILEDMGVKLVAYEDEDQLEASYDLLFAQHHLVIDYLLSTVDISFEKIVVSILGLGGMEGLPSMLPVADTVLFVSEEAADYYSEEIGEIGVDYRIFPNSADEAFFDAGNCNRSMPSIPKKIAVISNHVPHEVLCLKDAVPLGTSIDYLGYEGRAVKITPHLLIGYDLVITIGRTVQDCLAVRVPCYCYDHFGGPGFMCPDDVKMHANANFSGRSMQRKLSAQELWLDICDNYENAISNLNALHEIARVEWRFEHHFDLLYDHLAHISHTEEKRFPKDYPESATNRFRLDCLCRAYRETILRTTGLAQLYWRNEEGSVDESHSLSFRYHYRTWIDAGRVGGLPNSALVERFDPDVRPCRVSFRLSSVSGSSGELKESKSVSFFCFDPMVDLPMMHGGDALGFEFATAPIDDEELDCFLRETVMGKDLAESSLKGLEKNTQSLKWLIRKMKIEMSARLRRLCSRS